MSISIGISTPIGCTIVLDMVDYGVQVILDGYSFPFDLVVVCTINFDIMLGMD